MQQFENLRASTLYCSKCGGAMPVRERLLLVLPDREIYEYLCSGCAGSLGRREVTAGDLAVRGGIPAKPGSRRPQGQGQFFLP